MLYSVNEIFSSIQGEGCNTGMLVTFVRFAGCNLNCPWCDTDHTERMYISHDDILDWCMQDSTGRVILTGGEPSQQNLMDLLMVLKREHFWTAIETNGTSSLLCYKGAGLLDWITVSPKTPEVCVDATIDEIKVVYPGEVTLAAAGRIRAKYHYVQPCDGPDIDFNTQQAIKFVKEQTRSSHPQWRLGLQTHKILKLK